jgi:hypothetical protein
LQEDHNKVLDAMKGLKQKLTAEQNQRKALEEDKEKFENEYGAQT